MTSTDDEDKKELEETEAESVDAAPEETEVEEELVELSELEILQKKHDEHYDGLLRAKAEVENIKKRSSKEVENAYKYSIESILQEIIPIYDSLSLSCKLSSDKTTKEQLEEGKKFPRTSEFLYKKVDALEEIKQLAGVYQPVEEGDGSMGSNISKTANKISNIMKEKNIQPGTPEWFQLWFSKPYLTGEKPYGE